MRKASCLAIARTFPWQSMIAAQIQRCKVLRFVIARALRARGNLGKALPSRTGRRFVVPAIVGEGHAPPGAAQTIRTGYR